ncbi:replication initiation protein [Hymenobacter psychrophilus]|uniref:Initiator Replication protein n=1 Tax=Hymenobacter psychrophilus TaxID=651662 RepID=A0A1H3PB42_9BACT|nr:replication initiation protein [Hymenobacter psychrophilus]SDY98307.1 Initiator Replication protein [Hymenobacter psychrophilus]
MDQELTPDLEVRHSNALTNARFEFSELQMDLFFFMLSKLRKSQSSLVYQLNIKELSLLTGKKYDFPYLWQATDGMMSRVFSITTGKYPEQLSMFQRVKYLTGTGIIEFELTKHILPHLYHLKDNFTSFGLSAALRLTSKYAKRIYPICSQWKDLGKTKRYHIRELKTMLDLIDDKPWEIDIKEKLKSFKDFRVNVLDRSVKQINEHTELHISYKLEKVGRTYEYITFIIKPQALATPIPIDLAGTAQSLSGVQQSHFDNAARVLDELRITDAKHRQTIMSSAAHVAEVNRYNHDLKTGKVKASRNAGGLLLVRLGLVAAKPSKAT